MGQDVQCRNHVVGGGGGVSCQRPHSGPVSRVGIEGYLVVEKKGKKGQVFAGFENRLVAAWTITVPKRQECVVVARTTNILPLQQADNILLLSQPFCGEVLPSRYSGSSIEQPVAPAPDRQQETMTTSAGICPAPHGTCRGHWRATVRKVPTTYPNKAGLESQQMTLSNKPPSNPNPSVRRWVLKRKVQRTKEI